MPLTRSDILIIDATVITGILVLLTLTTISDIDPKSSEYEVVAWGETYIAAAVISTIVLFIMSAVKETKTELYIKRAVQNNQDYKEFLRKNLMENREDATHSGLKFMLSGFLYLVIALLIVFSIRVFLTMSST